MKHCTDTATSSSHTPDQESNKDHLCVTNDNPYAYDGQTVANKQVHMFTKRKNWKSTHSYSLKFSVHPYLKDLIDLAGWSRLLVIGMPNSNARLVKSSIKRWWDMTQTFHLPFVKLDITLYDFSFITGIYDQNNNINFILNLTIENHIRHVMSLISYCLMAGISIGKGMPLSEYNDTS